MAVTHFDPYFSVEDLDFDYKTACGVVYPEFGAGATSIWEDVTCKRCLKMKKKLQAGVDSDEKHIVEQMGDMADWMMRNNDDPTTADTQN